MSKRIILFSIGSVQDFIINSRRTIDLYNSSKILSEIISSGINFFEKYNMRLVLPNIELGSKNIPNYFLIIYENNKYLGKELEKYIRDHYLEMFLSCIKEGYSKYEIENYKRQFSEQLNSSLDIYWVEYGLEDEFRIENSDEYKKVYDRLYEYLNGIKNIKKFNSMGEEGKKCSICGKGNAIFINPKISINNIPQFKYKFKEYEENSFFELLDKLRINNVKITENEIKKIRNSKKSNSLSIKKYQLNKKEMLCSVCYLKRVYRGEERISIPSMAEISISYWLKNIKKDKKYDQYEQVFQEVFQKTQGLDEYESRYPEAWRSKSFANVGRNNIENLITVFNHLKNKDISSYYCVYRMDIDDLGKWMNGKYKKDNTISFYEYQSDLSKRINNFFDYVREETKKIEKGLLVYAGGDDLLVLIPIHEIYDFIKTINRGFANKIKIDGYKGITYSQGIFITHYKAPLGEIIRISKEELENVKNRYKRAVSYFDVPKNASVISIMNEGYDKRSVYYKNDSEYKVIDGNKQKSVTTNEFLFCNLAECFLSKLSYYHDRLEAEFIEINKNIEYQYECNEFIHMISAEQKRLIKRSILDKKDFEYESIIETNIDILNKNLMDFLKTNCTKENALDLENYFNLFHIIRKFNSIIKEGVECENNEDKAK